MMIENKNTWLLAYLKNGLYCLAIFLILIIATFSVFGCNNQESQAVKDQEAVDNIEQTMDKLPPKDSEFTILATGDIMMHDTQIKAGWQSEHLEYDYAYMFEQIKPILQEGDLVIGNLEVPLAGEAAHYSGYPMFNAPEILATNLKQAGFDVVSTANNHCLDKRYNGLVSTLDYLDEAGLMHTGTARSSEEQAKILTTVVEEVKIALIAATYGTNGMTLPKGKEYGVNFLDSEMLLEQVQAARKEGAQYVIVMLHWGEEYKSEPNKAQISLANILFDGGADLILGHHPHVLQKGEIIITEKPLGVSEEARENFVMYSLGNLVSSQKGLERLSSLILRVNIGVDGVTKEPFFKNADYIPIYTQKVDRKGKMHFVVWPIEKALVKSQSESNPFIAEDVQALSYAWDHILGSQMAMSPIQLARDPI